LVSTRGTDLTIGSGPRSNDCIPARIGTGDKVLPLVMGDMALAVVTGDKPLLFVTGDTVCACEQQSGVSGKTVTTVLSAFGLPLAVYGRAANSLGTAVGRTSLVAFGIGWGNVDLLAAAFAAA